MRTSILIMLLILSPAPVLACVTPDALPGDGVLCHGTYEIEELRLDASVDGNASVLTCPNRLKTGLLVEADGIRIKNLTVRGCGNSVYIEDQNNVSLYGVTLEEGNNGVVLMNATGIRITRSTIRTEPRSILWREDSAFDTFDSSIESRIVAIEASEGDETDANETGEDDAGDAQENRTVDEETGEEDVTQPEVHEVNLTLDEEAMRDIFMEVLLHVNLSDEEREMLADELVADYTAHYRDEIRITRRFEVHEDHTKVTLDISATESLQDVRIYEEIPKCAAQYTEEMTFSSDVPRVIKDDPLIMWEYDELEAHSINYLVQDSLPPACRDMFRTAIIPKSSRLNARIEEIQAEEQSRTHILAVSVLVAFVFMLVVYSIWQRR